MFARVYQLTDLLDSRIKMFEENKTADVDPELIISTNTKLLEQIKVILEKLHHFSGNTQLLEKYDKLVNSLVV